MNILSIAAEKLYFFLLRLRLTRRSLVALKSYCQAHKRRRVDRAHRKALAQAWPFFNRLWQSPPEPTVVWGTPSNQCIPVVMCLWNRADRVPSILNMLDAQEGGHRVRLLLWNNCEGDRSLYNRTVDSFQRSGALASVELFHSPHNIRGIGRFIFARKLRLSGYNGPLIMLDDDQSVSSSFISTALSSHRERQISGFWAWIADPRDYWKRDRAEIGDPANYVGTGGCVCDIDLFLDSSIFTEIPYDALFVEDIWMSRYAISRGWTLRRAHTEIRFIGFEDNQFHGLVDHKTELWRSLHELYPLGGPTTRRQQQPDESLAAR